VANNRKTTASNVNLVQGYLKTGINDIFNLVYEETLAEKRHGRLSRRRNFTTLSVEAI
jgi:hypothetical protein